MRRRLPLLLALLPGAAMAQTSHLGIFLQGTKIGWSRFAATPDSRYLPAQTRSDSLTSIRTGLLGADLKMSISSKTWSTPAGKPVRMEFKVESGGLSQTVQAVFREKDVAIDVLNSGRKTHTVLPMPKGQVVDDPLTLVAEGKLVPGKTVRFFVLDPMTIAFVPNDVKVLGKAKVDGVDTTHVRIDDPRAWTDVYLSGKGDLVKATNAMGFEMKPMSEAEATAEVDGASTPDLADATTVKTDRPIADTTSAKPLSLLFIGENVPPIPSDAHQTVKQVQPTNDKPGGVLVTIHPTAFDPTALRTDKIGQAQWLKPSLNIPSNEARFKKVAADVTKGQKTIGSVAESLRLFVFNRMEVDAGIGVLRDAEQILNSPRGVCRDHAILLTTLLRSAGIPARLCSGLVYMDNRFYYHAWAEAWDGKTWVGLDSTRPEKRLSSVHIKLADGNVDTAFVFPVLSGVRIQVNDRR